MRKGKQYVAIAISILMSMSTFAGTGMPVMAEETSGTEEVIVAEDISIEECNDDDGSTAEEVPVEQSVESLEDETLLIEEEPDAASDIIVSEEELPADTVTGDVEINEESFPDENFRNYVLTNFDTDGDGALSQEERDAVTTIDISSKKISSVKGIEFYTELESLNCGNNQLTSLDISRNVKLTDINCCNNQLTNIDLTNNIELDQLICYNNQITQIDISKCIRLNQLYCSDNPLSELNLTYNEALCSLRCNNCNLQELDLSNNKKLYDLSCMGNSLKQLDLSQNIELLYLYCGNNLFTTLDISQNTKIQSLWCDDGKLTKLDCSNNQQLVELWCSGNQLMDLNIKKCSQLTAFGCEGNQLKFIDLSGCPELSDIRCSGNQLSCLSLTTQFYSRFQISPQTCTFYETADHQLDLSTIEGFDPNKVSDLDGGTISGNILTVTDKDRIVTYTYNCGKGIYGYPQHEIDFTMDVTMTIAAVPVTKLILNKSSVSINVGSTKTLTTTITPENASNKNVTWKSSNTNVAFVSQKGVVKGVAAGTATITCTAADGSGKKATCKVTVTQPVTKITLNKTSASVFINKTITLTPTIAPTDAFDQSVTWKSSNTNVAFVSQKGVVKGVAAGTATITCTAADGSKVKATCKITVTKPVTKIKLNKTSASIFIGKTVTLKPTVAPSSATNTNVSWKSSNTAVATVSSKGVVTGKKAGTVTITCTAADGSKVKATCKITVTKPVTKIKLNKTSTTIKKGKTVTLTATIAPSNATNKNVTWKSSDTSIATVSSKGVVTGKKAGTVTITCTAADGSKIKATCKVTVTK